MKTLVSSRWSALIASLLVCSMSAAAAETSIHIKAADPGRPVSSLLTGVCIEDVNHEIYGGLYSQMLFGESFQEPPAAEPVKGFSAVDGTWSVKGDELIGSDGAGPKLLSTHPPFAAGEVGVEVYLPGPAGAGIHNAGLIVKVSRSGPGADNFNGYEISIDAMRHVVALGRHRHDWRPLAEAKADVAPDRWIALSAKLTERTIEVRIDGKPAIQYEDRERPLTSGAFGLRNWESAARYRHLWVDQGSGRVDLPFAQNPDAGIAVSGMWRPIRTGSATLRASIETHQPFVGSQSQRIEHAGGDGEVGIENKGLNRWGLWFEGGKPYEGYVWARAQRPVDLYVSLESSDGSQRVVETKLAVSSAEWRRYDLTLTPSGDLSNARFALRLKAPGAVTIGHAFLQPGTWSRFKDLPLRRDVVEGMIHQGISVLRYGGSMVNAREYRWKKMIGPRDRRPPYHGTWYPFSSNGWGIIDFLNLCEAAGFEGVPAFNIDETPRDMVDFIEYVNGPADSVWGRRRAADGHPMPYHLKHVELGNEERVDDVYVRKFAALATAIWAKDRTIVPVVGDFGYHHAITDPMKMDGADSRITSLAGQQAILHLAKERDQEVWFDIHVWTEGPGAANDLNAMPSYIDALDKLADGAKHRVVIFEFNANNHDQRRAIGNALAIGRVERDGRLPIATSANGLQVDKENDNGWDQGLLFLNQSKVWLQPPGYVTQMIAKSRLPLVLPVEVMGDPSLDVTAERTKDGKAVTVRIVNIGNAPIAAALKLDGFSPTKPSAEVVTLVGPLNATNTSENTDVIVPRTSELPLKPGQSINCSFPPHSFTVLRLE